MERIPEPELMDDAEQALAYAAADFDEPHAKVLELFRSTFPGFQGQAGTRALDLGCGPADISIRFARVWPDLHLTGIDGAMAMLVPGMERIAREGLQDRIRLVHGMLPDDLPDDGPADLIISNSLLHHLHDPGVLWKSVLAGGRPGSLVFIVDLMRPPDKETAARMQRDYVAGEPEVLQRDFYHSLLASFTPEEVRQQLAGFGLDKKLAVEEISDRHLMVFGVL